MEGKGREEESEEGMKKRRQVEVKERERGRGEGSRWDRGSGRWREKGGRRKVGIGEGGGELGGR